MHVVQRKVNFQVSTGLRVNEKCSRQEVQKLVLKGHCHGHFLAFLVKWHQNYN